MKKHLLISFLAITTTFTATAQIVNIPDANFKAYLLADLSINTNSDTAIQLSEAQTFNGAIVCSNLTITDLTGIEEFTSLYALDCSNNQLTGLDLSTNTALFAVDCSNNQISNLTINSNPALTYLTCAYNQLTGLNISNDLALAHINSEYNQITSLNINNNTALVELDLRGNQLSGINVDNNTALVTLALSENVLTSLNVDNNTSLVVFGCNSNQLTTLDISNNGNLTYFSCSNNLLTTLNAANGNNTAISNMSFIANNNPNLPCIQVDDAAWSNTNWTNIDTIASFSANCGFTSSVNENIEIAYISVYPNPTADMINFSATVNLQIANINGQVIYNKKNINSISLSSFSSGIYFISLLNGKGEIIQRSKIVKE
jgi:hypothetical protein